MNCKTCGHVIPQDADFCPECGTPVVAPDANPQVPPFAGSRPGQHTVQNRNVLGPLEQSRFFHFSSGIINAMEQSGFFRKPLLWLYMLFAFLNILIPVYLLFLLISRDLLNQMGVGGFLLWAVMAFAGWMGFQLWWNRKDKITKYFRQEDEFFAIPLFSHYIQTTGEWLGMSIAIVGTGAALVTWLFWSGNPRSGLGVPIPLQNLGIAGLIVSPIIGFTIILVSKVVAELYRALASIANNTKQMASER